MEKVFIQTQDKSIAVTNFTLDDIFIAMQETSEDKQKAKELIMKFKTIDEIADIVHENAKQKGFHDFSQPDSQFINEQLLNLHSEVSELHESWRNGNFNMPCDKSEKMKVIGIPMLTCAEEEYADIIIRALDQCRRLGIDISRAIGIKHQFNTTREHRHGGKLS